MLNFHIYIYFLRTHLNYLYFYSFFKNCYWMHLENQLFFFFESIFHIGLAWWLSGKEFTCHCRRHRFDPWGRISPGEENGNPLQYSCLGNSMERGAWQATVHGVTKLLGLSNNSFSYYLFVTLCLWTILFYLFVISVFRQFYSWEKCVSEWLSAFK